MTTAQNESERDGYNAPRGRYIDFHCHMLPKMDDGADSVDTSLEMIHHSVVQGVCGIVLTPHFYASSDSPEHFLAKRNHALARLRETLTTPFPILMCGAEVQYFDGITVMDELESLRIEKTPLLMIEMPFKKWSSRVIDDIMTINERQNTKVIIAHIERYIFEQKSGVLDELVENGVTIQSNAEFFLERFKRGKALKLLEENKIHILGSDSHNMQSRKPNLAEAFAVIREKSGDETVSQIISNQMKLLKQNQQ